MATIEMLRTQEAIEKINFAIQAQSTSLYLNKIGINEIPKELLGLKDTLVYLNLSDNRIEALPEWFGEMGRLKEVDLSENYLREEPVFPDIVMNLEKNIFNET